LAGRLNRIGWLPIPARGRGAALPWLAAAMLLASGCGWRSAPPQAPRVPVPTGPVTEATRTASPGMAPLQCSVSDIGFRLLRDLAQQRSGDVVISPAAAAVALSLLHEAAAPADAARLRDMLGLSELGTASCTANAEALREILLRPGRGVSSRAAMALWVPLDPPARPAFARAARGRYKARLTALDLTQPSGRAAVDRWFTWATAAQRNAAPEPPPGGVMVAAATALVHGEWADPFPPSATRPGRFTRADGTARTVPMMRHRTIARYARLAEVQRVDLPLGEGEVSLTLLIPDDRRGLGRLLAELSPQTWAEATLRGRFAAVDLALPRLSLQDTARLDKVLRIGGLDVSAAVPGALHLGPMWLVTPLKIGEHGLNSPPPLTPPEQTSPPAELQAVTVTADRPFVFVVAQAAGNMPLYAGVVR